MSPLTSKLSKSLEPDLLGKALKLARTYSDLPQKDMAVALGVSQSYLSEIEAGKKSPTLQLLQSYSTVLDVPLSSLLFFAEQIDGEKPLTQTARIGLADKVVKFLAYCAPAGTDDGEQT